ncbi:MAG: glycosyltransferase [Gammaproteobacteria bacterium]|nr:glycosyltransferase [Gammaproteobacteria bacterium]
MFLSIIIPTFNRAEVLGRALDSVRSQCWLEAQDDWEIIVVDDGSTDATASLLASDYPEVRVLSQPNSGVSSARNRGLEAASGEWLALLDSDDEWLPHKLRRQFEALEASGLQFCHTEEIWVRNGVRVNQMHKHQKSGGWIFERCLPLCAVSPSSTIMHRSIFDSVGLFDENLPACEDYDMWLRVSAQYQVAYVEQACINKYGGHADQLSRRHWGMDRFRVIALEKILATSLSQAQSLAAKEILIKKLSILIAGARKHGNHNLLTDCQRRLDYWQQAA